MVTTMCILQEIGERMSTEQANSDQLLELKSKNEALQVECQRLKAIVDGRGLCKNCSHVSQQGEGYYVCLLGETRDGEATHPEALAFAADYEGYHATLEVKENYGCNQWRPA